MSAAEGVDEEALSRVARAHAKAVEEAAARNRIALGSSAQETALRYYVVLTYLPALVPISGVDAFHARFYWFAVHREVTRLTSGVDAGLEQQAHQLLEHADIELDWYALEHLERRAQIRAAQMVGLA
jgi:hypothetical protein